MKTIIVTAFLSLMFTIPAFAERINIDLAFTKTNNYLNNNNLALTAGAGGETDDTSAYNQGVLLFYGQAAGNPKHSNPKRALAAKRAAVVIAQRAALEYLENVLVVGVTNVKDCMVQDDVVVSTVSGMVRGSQVVVQEYNKETDTAIAVIKLGMRGPNGFASSFYEKISKDQKFRDSVNIDKKQFQPSEQMVMPDVAYDGLIIDATEQSFRPALINRIFAAKGEVLYDPAKISQKVLVEQGCGEYSNSIEKARAALSVRGVTNPLVIKASGAINSSDLQVSDEVAVTVYSANQKGGFMASAKVAFVLR
ncbi:MAG: hypothetical protein PHN84_08260 [Desulfuromonadaceae bacterium]|nr:hypothetical protein [Desulfuromonadaceae bacterium]MDD2856319.1 hypothetical protein [Desulfuromonadaceae bacterium]